MEGSAEADVIYNALERVNFVGTATILLNEGYRKRNNVGSIRTAQSNAWSLAAI